jgi:hypothetical protein
MCLKYESKAWDPKFKLLRIEGSFMSPEKVLSSLESCKDSPCMLITASNCPETYSRIGGKKGGRVAREEGV